MANEKEKLIVTISFRVSDSVYRKLNQIMEKDRRKLSEVAQALLIRGMAARERDGELFEPDEDVVVASFTKQPAVAEQLRKAS